MRFTHRLEQNRFEIDLFIQRIVQYAPDRSNRLKQNLDRIGPHQLRQLAETLDRFGRLVQQIARVRQNRAELNRPQRIEQIVEKRLKVFALLRQAADHLDDFCRLVPQHAEQNRIEIGAIGQAEQRKDLLARDRRAVSLREKCDHLVQQRLRVAHAAFGGAGDRVDRLVVDRDSLAVRDQPQPFRNLPGRNRQQVEALAARNDRLQDLVNLGRRKDELHMRRRFLDRLQKCVPRLRGQHMNFVDDVNLIAPGHRLVHDVFGQLAHIRRRIAAGGVDLDHVEAAFLHNGAARDALAARLAVLRVETVHRLGENPGERGFSDAARTDEQIGMGGPLLTDRVPERAHDMLLPDHVGETLRPPLPGDYLVFTHN